MWTDRERDSMGFFTSSVALLTKEGTHISVQNSKPILCDIPEHKDLKR